MKATNFPTCLLTKCVIRLFDPYQTGRLKMARQCNFNFHFSHCECEFPRAAMTNYRKLGGFKQQKFILSQFWRLGDWNQGVGRARTPFECSVGKASLVTSSFWLVLAILVVPWLVYASRQSLPPSARGLLPCVSEALCQNFSLLINTQITLYLGPSRIQYDLVLTWLHLQRHYFQIRSHSQVPVDKNFWGTLKIWNLLMFSVADESC